MEINLKNYRTTRISETGLTQLELGEFKDAIETLTNIAMSLECEYAYSQELKMAYLNSISAVAFDGERGKHYAKLMLEFITTGEGEAELYALESDMDNDAIWWVRNNT